jgi:dTDP-4-amino-4,6-dideoxygalactose transaminase
MKIPFNKPAFVGNELEYIKQAIYIGQISGNGHFTKKCHHFFEEKFSSKCLLTTSCTDALEMCSLLLNIQPGDEVIIPSYTFVSTANAFVLRGAKIVFADSQSDHPNMDAESLEQLITPRTRAIVVVHYAGIACDMDKIMELAQRYSLFVVEDAAQAIDSYYKGKPLGTIGHLAAFSFHETKNVISGEGGLLVINDKQFEKRAEILWEKGTNRTAFFKGEVDKYGWVDVGSSFLPSDLIAAFLYAQLEKMDVIQSKRKLIWDTYFKKLLPLKEQGHIKLPIIPEYATNNAHMFYIICKDVDTRDKLIAHLKKQDILSVFHYLSLHKSPFYASRHDGRSLTWSDFYSDRLLRLPFYFELSDEDQSLIVSLIHDFFS